MYKLILLLISLLPVVPLAAADLAYALMPPDGSVASGSTVRLDLVAINPGAIDVPFQAPSAMVAELSAPDGKWPVTLEAASPAANGVDPGGFAVRAYRFTLPAGASGRLVLTAPAAEGVNVHTVLHVVEGNAPVGPPPAAATPLTRLETAAPVASLLARTFAGRFLPNQPIYFLYGSGSDQAAKFQFSFDYRLASLRWGDPGEEKISTLRVGYTQRSLWDIDASSSPFYDTSYMPEIAVVTDVPLRSDGSKWFTWMGLRAGYLHESNGRDGDDSRSLNTFYLRPRFIVGSLDSWFMVVLPEIHAYVGGFSENERIKDYRGYGKLRFYFGRNDGPTLRVSTWAGKDFDHASYQLDLTYPLSLRWLDVQTYLQVQYFNGYGESLRSYESKSDTVRFGFALVR